MEGNLTFSAVQEYLVELVPPREQEFLAMEAHAESNGFPIIGPAAGYACYQIARMVGAKQVFELGSGFGYSTAWFARAVRENGGGLVHHTVWDAALSQQARGHLSRLGFEDLVRFHVAEAVATLAETPGPFDLVFNDIDKQAYATSLEVIKEKLRPGGVLIVDNLLWSGRVFDGADHSESTDAIRAFTRQVTSDPDWIATLLPIRDGLMVAYKR